MSLFWEKRRWNIFWQVDSFFGHALKFTKIVECCRKFGEMANITICLMVIADLAESGRSVFSWAVIADLSFESLRFARWVFSHLSPLFSAVIRASSHFHLLVTSFHQKYSKDILVQQTKCFGDYWFFIAEGTTTRPCDECGRWTATLRDITGHW